MAEKNIEDTWRRADDEVRKNLPPGVKLVRTLRGHTGVIGRIAWSPDGRMLASPSADRTIRQWDAETGQLLRILGGHLSGIWSVAFDPAGQTMASGSADKTVVLRDAQTGRLLHTLGWHSDQVQSVVFDSTGRTLASGSSDQTVMVWDVTSGKLLRILKGHQDSVLSVAFDPAGQTLASGSSDQTVKFWEVVSGNLLRTCEWRQGPVYSMVFDPTGRTLASGSRDNTVKIWEVASGRLLRTLEGHTGAVVCVTLSSDGCLLASKGDNGDDSIRIWNSDTSACVAIIPEPSSTRWPSGLAFHPHRPLLATVGSDPGTPERDHNRIIHIWELDLAVLQPAAPTITYISAKVVLVGESNVGKSYLAHRIATDAPPAEGTIVSTHGMKFWPLELEQLCSAAKPPENQRRDVVLWDMGGQKEYRLIHQLFLHDTTVALVLLDPTRGSTAFKEVETWNKYLDQQLRGRAPVKLLVGAKLDQPSNTMDRQGVDRLCQEFGFAGFYETSARTGRGLPELRDAVAKAIDWDGLGQTSRPELFQRIRDEIGARSGRGEVVLHVADLHRALSDHPPTEEETKAVDAVTEQLATQGMIARSRVSSGEPVLVLQVQVIERYAGSLIVAARDNPRGVPALDLQAIAQADFPLPGILDKERLAHRQEMPILECTVQLMLEHGICFQHEGLLIFPTLFAPAPAAPDATLPHAVSLYYDFAGAIDNIYASLVSWLVLAQNFGRVRVSSEGAEFEVKDGGLCGLRKVARPGGFAHMDIYFEADTPGKRRGEFISFVEEHLRQNGVEIYEHVAIKCPCGHQFQEETLRQRIARGDKDVGCPVCETRHSLTEGAAESRQRSPQLAQWTRWALKSIEGRRQESAEQAVQVLEQAAAKPVTGTIRLLHLSDLQFTAATPIQARLRWLVDDIKKEGGLGFKGLDYLVISGDFTDRGCAEGFEKAYEFVSGLTKEFDLSAERCIFVPGNHDVKDLPEAFEKRTAADGQEVTIQSDKYPLRFKAFSEDFYHKFLQRFYPPDYTAQGMAIPFWETGIQFLALNSCWQIDQFNRKRAGLHPEAVAHAISEAEKQEGEARKSGQLALDKQLLRIAVWHHSVTAPDFKMTDIEFLGNLQKIDVRLALHGDVHELRRDLIGYWHPKKLHIIGSGSFGAAAVDRPESTPRFYNVLEITRDLKSARVHTRCQPKPDGPWKGWNEWERPDGRDGGVPYYDIKW